MRIRNLFSASTVLIFSTFHIASAGYVQTWLDAQGGCPAHRKLIPPRGPIQNLDKFIDRSALEWTDDDLKELGKLYAVCASDAMTPADIPQSKRIISVAQKEYAQEFVEKLFVEWIQPARERRAREQRQQEAQSRIGTERQQAEAARLAQRRDAEARSAAEQDRAVTEQAERLKRQRVDSDAERTRQLDRAQAQARSDLEAAEAIEREAEAAEKHAAELKRITDESTSRRKAAETRLALAKSAAEAERARTPNPPTVPQTETQTATAAPPAQSIPATAPPADDEAPKRTLHGCEKPAVRKMFLDEFNRLASSRDRQSAMDLTEWSTLELDNSADDDSRFVISCEYTALLDDGKRQRFRMKLQPNSLGSPYSRFTPLSRPR